MSRRPVENIVADLVDVVDAARELVARGRGAYDADRMLRLAGEAVVGRIGDAAAKLRDQVGDDLPDEIPWDDVIANRIIVDHVYHRVDYEALWNTLERDIRKLTRVLVSWAQDRGVRLDLLSHTEWDLGDRGRASRGSRGTDRDVAFSGLEVVCES